MDPQPTIRKSVTERMSNQRCAIKLSGPLCKNVCQGSVWVLKRKVSRHRSSEASDELREIVPMPERATKRERCDECHFIKTLLADLRRVIESQFLFRFVTGDRIWTFSGHDELLVFGVDAVCPLVANKI